MKPILLKQMKTVEEKVVDIEIKNGIITRIEDSICEDDQLVINGHKEYYVSSGWIDIHTHCFDKFELYGDRIDTIGYPTGVTTVVDAGTCGADTIDEFIQQKQNAKTNAYAFLNIASCGIERQDELSDLRLLESGKIDECFEKYSDILVGLKARMSASVLGNSGDTPLHFAIQKGNALHVPVMVHVGSEPSSLSDIMSLVRKDDIITHIFNPKANGILDINHHIKPFVKEAKQKGVLFDVGHGSDSFSFDVCKTAREQDILCDTISTDIYFRNREHGPVYDMATTLDKLMACGYSLKEVIDRVTIAAASAIQKPELAKLEVGGCGDLTIFQLIEEPKTLIDSKKETFTVHQHIKPCAVILHQEYLPCKEVA